MARMKRRLPWREPGVDEDEAGVHYGAWFVAAPTSGAVVLGCVAAAEGSLTPAHARQMAVALLMAADVAEELEAEAEERRKSAPAAPQTSSFTVTSSPLGLLFGCAAHGVHPHNGMVCLDCPRCRS